MHGDMSFDGILFLVHLKNGRVVLRVCLTRWERSKTQAFGFLFDCMTSYSIGRRNYYRKREGGFNYKAKNKIKLLSCFKLPSSFSSKIDSLIIARYIERVGMSLPSPSKKVACMLHGNGVFKLYS